MGFFTKFIFKHGPGSPGQTAKVICKQMSKMASFSYATHWQQDPFRLVMLRFEACMANPFGYNEDQTYLHEVSENRWRELIDQTKGSLSVLIFILLFFETRAFRNVVSHDAGGFTREQQKENRQLILEIIYNVVKDTPYNNSLSFAETLEILDDIGGCYYFDISTHYSQTG